MGSIAVAQAETIGSLIDALRESAVESGSPAEEAEAWATATRTHFSHMLRDQCGPRIRHSVRAYFAGVARRRAMRSRGDHLRDARRSLVLTSIAEDLAAVSVSEDRIMRELSEVYPTGVSRAQLERITQDVMRRRAS